MFNVPVRIALGRGRGLSRVYRGIQLMAKDKNWIQKATAKNKGGLRKKAGVKAGEKIPVKKLNKLAKSKNPKTRKQANLAKTLRKMR